MTQKLASYHHFPGIRYISLAALPDAKSKRSIFKHAPQRLGKKAKMLLVFGIVIVFLVSIFAFLPKQNGGQSIIVPQSSDNPTNSTSPTQGDGNSQQGGNNILSEIGIIVQKGIDQVFPISQPAGPIASANAANSAMWKAVAKNAWQYFQPNVGVNKDTGIPYAGLDYPYITDWDLGSYIEAVMDANKVGLINDNGTWGSSMRMEKIVSFLETRELNTSTPVNCPYWNYQASDGKHWTAEASSEIGINIIDTGKLFVALNNLESFNSSLKPRIDNLVHNVYGNRTDYTSVISEIYADSLSSTSIYAYFVDSGYASFFPALANAPARILSNIQNAGNVTMDNNIQLPKSDIVCDPLLCSVFELKNNSYLSALAYDVYLAHEAKYDADPSQKYVAYSEGNSGLGLYIWEKVVTPSGDTWTISGSYYEVPPIIYNKVALSFFALYNTTYTHDMCVYLEENLPDASAKGYYDGMDTDNRQVLTVGSNTNSLILSAARYAIQS